MPEEKPRDSQIVSVRLPHDLVRRLERDLDWHERSRRRPSSRTAAIRQALSLGLADQEQRAGRVAPHALRQHCLVASQSLSNGRDPVASPPLRHVLPWPRERFDAVVEGRRADHHVELQSAKSGGLRAHTIHDSSHGPGQRDVPLRLRDCSDRNASRREAMAPAPQPRDHRPPLDKTSPPLV
jgi:hypothetical protein